MEIVGRYHAPATLKDAAALQRKLRDLVLPRGRVRDRLVAGVDVGYKGGIARAAVVVLRRLEPVEEIVIEEPVAFPYVPGLLSFREIPPLLTAWKRLKTRPDVVIVDGQGLAHPRRFGVACHFGLLTGVPTIGCAKSRLVGEFKRPAPRRGSWSPLRHRGETVGAVLRTQDGGNPVFVSPGHLIGLRRAISVVLACAPRYRLPEPQRRADLLTKSP
jgi:deoxyribonuclease V